MKRCTLAAGLSFLVLAACSIPRVEHPPVPAPQQPAPTPAPAPAPAPTPAPTPSTQTGWMDMPKSPGDWFYKAVSPFSYSVYGASDTRFDFVLRCDRASRTISVGRVSNQQVQQPMRIRTESTDKLLTTAPRRGSMESLLAVDLPAGDPILDAMAISKGRFAVEVGGETTLYIPSWPEVTRLIEDCR